MVELFGISIRLGGLTVALFIIHLLACLLTWQSVRMNISLAKKIARQSKEKDFEREIEQTKFGAFLLWAVGVVLFTFI